MEFSPKTRWILPAVLSWAWVVVVVATNGLQTHSPINIYALYICIYTYNTSPAQFTTYQRVLASYYDPQQSSIIKLGTALQALVAHTHTHIYNTISHVCRSQYSFYTHIMRGDYPFYYSALLVSVSFGLPTLKQFPAPCLPPNLCDYPHTRTPPPPQQHSAQPVMLKW